MLRHVGGQVICFLFGSYSVLYDDAKQKRKSARHYSGENVNESSFFFSFLAGKERASAASNAAVNDNGSAGRLATPTSTKTVYGFLDFTTIVSDTMMIFKPSKTNGKPVISEKQKKRFRDGEIKTFLCHLKNSREQRKERARSPSRQLSFRSAQQSQSGWNQPAENRSQPTRFGGFGHRRFGGRNSR